MADIRIDPKKQFSKKLARWTSVFWFVFMTWLSVLLLLVPASAQFAVYMAIIATAVMIINVAAYTRNSIYEKLAFAMLDKTKLEIGLKNTSTTSMDTDNATERGEENG